MQFQLVLLALVASTTQILAAPATAGQEVAAFSSIPEGKTLSLANAKTAGVAAAETCYDCGYPCGGYYCCDPLPYCGYYTNPFQCVCTN